MNVLYARQTAIERVALADLRADVGGNCMWQPSSTASMQFELAFSLVPSLLESYFFSSLTFGGGRPDASLRNEPLCGDRVRRSALAVIPWESVLTSPNPLCENRACQIALTLGGAVRISLGLCGDRACRIALVVAPCVCLERGEPCAGIVRAGSPSLWRHAHVP